MNLLNGVLRPGLVLEVLDGGKIKASAPGLFTEEDKDLNPPIMPFFELMGAHSNTFSMPSVDDEVWILNLEDNPLQLYWFRKDPHMSHNAELLDGSENVEILCNRESGAGYATLYFTDGTGWMLRNDESKLQIHPDGSIELGMNWPHRTITIDDDAIHLGTDGEEHPACYGDVTSDVLSDLCGLIDAIGKVSKASPFTMAISAIISLYMPSIQAKIPKITSEHVKLD